MCILFLSINRQIETGRLRYIQQRCPLGEEATTPRTQEEEEEEEEEEEDEEGGADTGAVGLVGLLGRRRRRRRRRREEATGVIVVVVVVVVGAFGLVGRRGSASLGLASLSGMLTTGAWCLSWVPAGHSSLSGLL